jgi:hypothetical protein
VCISAEVGLDVGATAGFAVVRSCSVAGVKLSEGATEDGRLVGAALNRIVGLVFGLSRVNATGAEVGSDDSTSIKKRLTEPLGMSAKLSIHKTVITAAEATIATAAMVTFLATDMPFFPLAALAIVPAPVAADAPVEMAAWTAID